MNDSSEPSSYEMYKHPGFIRLLPDIMSPVEFNSTDTACICGDIQEDDYSPLYAWFNYLLIICILPFLSLFGMFTNVINVFIFSRKRMINSANTYLFFLACSDFFVILTGVFIFWVDSARSYIYELSRAPYITVYALPFGYMAQTMSIYFTVAAAVDCYVNVCWKLQAKSYCTTRRSRQIVGTIAISSIFYNSMRFPQFNLRRCLPDGSNEFVIEICPTTLFFAINTIYNVYLYMVLMTLLPFFFLLLLNVFIVAKQSMVEPVTPSRKTSLTSSGCENNHQNNALAPAKKEEVPERKPSNASSSTDDTITMIMVVILFLCCNTLALIVNLIETFGSPDPILINLLSDASNFLVVFNSSVNAGIYFIFNKEYRDLFLHYYLMFRERYCSKHKRVPSRPTETYRNGSSTNKKYIKATSNSFGLSRKADMRLDDINSPVWLPQQKLPNSNTTTTKLSPPEDETSQVCNGNLCEFHEISLQSPVNEISLQSPSSPFTPTIHMELLLMDEDEGWEDGTILSATSNPQPEPKKNGGIQSYMTEVKLADNGQNNSTPQMIVVRPDSGVAQSNTGLNL